MKTLLERLFRQCVGIFNRRILRTSTDSYNVLVLANFMAAMDSANYYNESMSSASDCEDNLELLTRAMKLRSIDDLILEFGVASGKTINHLASLTTQIVYGFDVFSGLPADWRTGFSKGLFAQEVPETVINAELVVGLFEETLDKFVSRTSAEAVSFLHVDCDLYSSTATIFRHLEDRIVPGTVIVFDEYFNYPGWRHHEYKAFQEFCWRKGIAYRYDSFVPSHQQVCVVIEKVNGPRPDPA